MYCIHMYIYPCYTSHSCDGARGIVKLAMCCTLLPVTCWCFPGRSELTAAAKVTSLPVHIIITSLYGNVHTWLHSVNGC